MIKSRPGIVLFVATILARGVVALELGPVPVELHYRGDIRSAYMSRGKVTDDRPVQTSTAEIGFPLSKDDWNFGKIGLWHFHYHSLTPRQREKRDRCFAEVDWGVWYANSWWFADDWAFAGRVTPRWFTLPFWQKKMPTYFEWHTVWSLENPYLTPSLLLRAGMRPQDYLYLLLGLSKPFDFWDRFAVTPGVYVDISDESMLEQNFGELSGGDRYQSSFGTVQLRLPLDYRLSENVRLFARLEQMVNVNPQARSNLRFCNHSEWTIFTIGADLRF